MKSKASFTVKAAITLSTFVGAFVFATNARAQQASAIISGKVVEDFTGNGVSADDALISSRTIRLYKDNGDHVFNAGTDTLVKTDTTRKDGTYAFRNLAAGTYFVQQDLPSRWVQSVPRSIEPDPIVTPAQCGPAPPERNDTIATAVVTGLIPGALGTYRARGEIGDNNYKELDVDLFQVQATAGSLMRVDLDAVSFGATLDPELRIFDAAGHPVAVPAAASACASGR